MLLSLQWSGVERHHSFASSALAELRRGSCLADVIVHFGFDGVERIAADLALTPGHQGSSVAFGWMGALGWSRVRIVLWQSQQADVDASTLRPDYGSPGTDCRQLAAAQMTPEERSAEIEADGWHACRPSITPFQIGV